MPLSIPPLLPLQWLQPTWLWLLFALAIPLLIHLIRRSRPREITFAAAQWLLPRQQRHWNRFVLRDRLLLLLRLLLVTLLALLLAQPLLKSDTEAQENVLLVDPRIQAAELDDFLQRHPELQQVFWLQSAPREVSAPRPEPQDNWRVLSRLSTNGTFRRAHILLLDTENPSGHQSLRVSPDWQWHRIEDTAAPAVPDLPRIAVAGDGPAWLQPVMEQLREQLGTGFSFTPLTDINELAAHSTANTAQADWLIYDTAGPLPAALQTFVQQGGLLITGQGVQWDEVNKFTALDSQPAAEAASVGRGSWLRYTQDWHSAPFYQRAALPELLWQQWSLQDWHFQFHSRSHWSIDSRPETPVPDSQVVRLRKIPLDRWLMLLIALLLLVERSIALSRREAGMVHTAGEKRHA
ncbi:BatA domain-containing protein [Microbulbifer mangrovi]|uniref:BatA domain-containing protein n=1 Tax=Microbulbifer mangrovi TaxID=927787 RepID=UPI0009908D47|nr:BatA domain-containing protein [Microbulbifer mangrovi]